MKKVIITKNYPTNDWELIDVSDGKEKSIGIFSSLGIAIREAKKLGIPDKKIVII